MNKKTPFVERLIARFSKGRTADNNNNNNNNNNDSDAEAKDETIKQEYQHFIDHIH